MSRATARPVDSLARHLATIEGKLSAMNETRNAMMSVMGLVTQGLHDGDAAHEARYAAGKEESAFFNPAYVYWKGYVALAFVARQACGETVDVSSLFMAAAKSDPGVRAELEAIHEAAPLGQVWTGEEYPAE